MFLYRHGHAPTFTAAELADDHRSAAGQQVFASVAVGIAEARWDRAGDSFRGWLWTIFHSRLMDFYRQARRQPLPVGDSEVKGRMEAAQSEASETTSLAGPDDEHDRLAVKAGRWWHSMDGRPFLNGELIAWELRQGKVYVTMRRSDGDRRDIELTLSRFDKVHDRPLLDELMRLIPARSGAGTTRGPGRVMRGK